MNDFDQTLRRIQRRGRISGRKRVHFRYTPEPGEPLAPPYPPEEEEDTFHLPFPEEDFDECDE